MRSRQTTVGVVGLGYWGPNLARNFAALPGAELTWLCDARPDVRDRFATTFPTARHTERLDDLLSDDGLEAIVLATPVPTHAELAVRVVEAGKHCFVEKPLAQSVAVEEPSELAARGECYMNPDVEHVVFAFMRFPSGLAARLHLSWLDPHKERS